MATSSCPVFTPSLEEFSVGIQEYVESIQSQIKPHGICKVIPPEGWWQAPDYSTIIESSTKAAIPVPVKQCVSGARGTYSLTLLEIPSESLKSFQLKANMNAEKKLPLDFRDSSLFNGSTISSTNFNVNQDILDKRVRRFWKTIGPSMEPPLYGADALGSLFGNDDASGWNVDRLDTLLKRYCPPIQGVTSAMLYAGQWAAMFAYHLEDMNLYSVNYLHAGCPKSWYSVQPKDRARFESMAASLFPEDRLACAEFLRHKRYLFSPTVLREYGIVADTVVQFPGEFVVTLPFSYHAGFNHGFNIAEATNFATRDWCEYAGVKAGICHCFPDSVRIDLNDFRLRVINDDKWIEHGRNNGDSLNDTCNDVCNEYVSESDDAFIDEDYDQKANKTRKYDGNSKNSQILKKQKKSKVSSPVALLSSSSSSSPSISPASSSFSSITPPKPNRRQSIQPCSNKPLFLKLHQHVLIKSSKLDHVNWKRGKIEHVSNDGLTFKVKCRNGVILENVYVDRLAIPASPPVPPSSTCSSSSLPTSSKFNPSKSPVSNSKLKLNRKISKVIEISISHSEDQIPTPEPR